MYNKSTENQRNNSLAFDIQPKKNYKDFYYIDQGDQFHDLNDCQSYLLPIQAQNQQISQIQHHQQFNFPPFYPNSQPCLNIEKNAAQQIQFQQGIITHQFQHLPINLSQSQSQFIQIGNQGGFAFTHHHDLDNPLLHQQFLQQVNQNQQDQFKQYILNSQQNKIGKKLQIQDKSFETFESYQEYQKQCKLLKMKKQKKSVTTDFKDIQKQIDQKVNEWKCGKKIQQKMEQKQKQLSNRIGKQTQVKEKQEEFSSVEIIDDCENQIKSGELQKQLFDNTLTGYVLKIFEIHRQVPLTESYVVEQVRANMNKLKRPDGTKYKGNIYKTVKGSLTSNGIFEKRQSDIFETSWTVNKEAACEFEKRTIQRFQHLADKRRILKKQKFQRQLSPEQELFMGALQQFEESHSYQLGQPVIENKYRHVYSLLDGFIISQTDNNHLNSILDYVENLEFSDDADFDQFQKIIAEYNIKEVLEGIIQSFNFFQKILFQKCDQYEIV